MTKSRGTRARTAAPPDQTPADGPLAYDVEIVPIADLTLDPENARKHDARNIGAIKASLRQFGQRKPLVVTHTLGVRAGGGTTLAAIELGWTRIAVHRCPAHWSEEQIRAFALADNRTAELAVWDEDIVAVQLDSLDGVIDMQELGFAPRPPRGVQVEDAPVEVPVVAVAQTGDVWQVGDHRIVCGDAFDPDTLGLAYGDLDQEVGVLLTDPPYGINLDTDYSKMGTGSPNALIKGTSPRKYRPIEGDTRPFDARVHASYFSHVSEQFWFGADYYRRTLPAEDLEGSWLVWDKRNEASDAGFGSGFELIYSRTRHKRDLLRFYYFGAFGAEARKRHHPTQKPVAMLLAILDRWSAPGCVVADPFAGSGSTLVAAARSGRVGVGIEIDGRYVDVIVRRLEEETGETGDRIVAGRATQ